MKHGISTRILLLKIRWNQVAKRKNIKWWAGRQKLSLFSRWLYNRFETALPTFRRRGCKRGIAIPQNLINKLGRKK